MISAGDAWVFDGGFEGLSAASGGRCFLRPRLSIDPDLCYRFRKFSESLNKEHPLKRRGCMASFAE